MRWMFILLITITQATEKPVQIDQIEGVRLMWPVQIQQGENAVPGVAHYQAILFASREVLDAFLEKQYVAGGLLFDLATGKQYTIEQKRITKKVEVVKDEFVGFDVTWKEEK